MHSDDDVSEPRPEILDGILAGFLKWLSAQKPKLWTNPNAVGYTPYGMENDCHRGMTTDGIPSSLSVESTMIQIHNGIVCIIGFRLCGRLIGEIYYYGCAGQVEYCPIALGFEALKILHVKAITPRQSHTHLGIRCLSMYDVFNCASNLSSVTAYTFYQGKLHRYWVSIC